MIYLRKFNTAMDAKGQVIDLPCVASWGEGDSSNVEYFSLYQKDKTKLNVTDDGTGIKANRGFIKFSANSSDGTIYINPNVPANKDCLILNDSGLYIDRKSSIDKDVAGVHYYGYDYSGLGGGFDIYVTIDDIVTYYLTDFYQFNEASNAMESLGEMRIAIRKFDPLYTGPEKEVIPVSAGTDIVVELNSEPVEIGLDELNESLTSITLPETVTRLTEKGFYACQYLDEVKIPDSVTEIGRHCFAYSYIKSLTLPPNLTTLDDIIEGCTSLEYLFIPASVTDASQFSLSSLKHDGILSEIHYGGTTEQWNLLYNRDIGPVKTIICTDGNIQL